MFNPFPKIARFNRDIVITEKLDGTNASVYIDDVTLFEDDVPVVAEVDGWGIAAGSRNRWLSEEQDNYGFAKWVKANAEELLKLGVGHHFGEWWGQGIQRGYGLAEKKFSLFNTHRWSDPNTRPICCDVVPILYHGVMSSVSVEDQLQLLRKNGSIAASGYKNPEGIVIYHTAANVMFKATCVNDDKAKGEQ